MLSCFHNVSQLEEIVVVVVITLTSCVLVCVKLLNRQNSISIYPKTDPTDVVVITQYTA